MKRSPFVVVAGLVLSMALSPDARAGCNTIPDAESAVTSGFAVLAEQDPAAEIPTLERNLIGFKGALGRMDRFALIPGQTTGFRLEPDGQCVHATERGLTVQKVPVGLALENPSMGRDVLGGTREPLESNLVLSIFTQRAPGEGVQALVLASEKVCEALAAGIGHGVRERGVELRCVPGAPVEVHPVGGRPHVQVRLPVDRKLYGGDDTGLRGPATVVLTEGLWNPDKYLTLLSKITAEGCAAHCDALVGIGASACVDRFYAILPDGKVVDDKIACEVTVPPDITKNVFKKQCENLVPPPAGLAPCDDNDPISPLQLWEDSCGGIHIPFDWTGIRKTASTPSTDITRWVAGRSATSRTEAGNPDSSRIWIPGREFLGSTPWDDASGTLGTTKWRKTDIDVWYPDDPSEEVGLRGSTDQPDSIVHVFPRMPVSIVCWNGAGTEGCMRVAEGGGVTCACEERYPAGCKCAIPNRPQYFECEGGDYDGMPCTRHGHCNSAQGSPNPNGSCSRKPTCRPDNKNGVWSGPWPGPPPPGMGQCWDDDDCTQPNFSCGHRLFDLKDRKKGPQAPEDLRELDAKIVTATGSRPRRGVCKNERITTCNHTPANPCAGNQGPCRGYTLRAEGKKN